MPLAPGAADSLPALARAAFIRSAYRSDVEALAALTPTSEFRSALGAELADARRRERAAVARWEAEIHSRPWGVV